jgi:hypothetical protein
VTALLGREEPLAQRRGALEGLLEARYVDDVYPDPDDHVTRP